MVLELFANFSIEWWHIPLLFLIGLIAESYGSLIGGGSILIQGTLLSLGVPIQAAIATDNAGTIGTRIGIISETYKNILKNKKIIFFMTIPLLIGGIIGTHLLITISPAIIKYTMIIAITYLLLYSHFTKNKKKKKKENNKKTNYVLLFIILFIIGIYSNFIGIGEGTFGKISLMLLLNLSFIQSHGLKTAARLPASIYSLIITTIYGFIILPYFITLLIANFIAGKYSTKFIKQIPEKHIKKGLTTITILFLLYLLFIY